MSKYKYSPDYRVSVGDVIKEYMEAFSMDLGDLSSSTWVPIDTLIGILNGTVPITSKMAHSLERVFSRPSFFWLMLGMDEKMRKETCPYCGNDACEAVWVDNGVGMVQCGPCVCDLCYAFQIGAYDDESKSTDEEKKIGWYASEKQEEPQ